MLARTCQLEESTSTEVRFTQKFWTEITQYFILFFFLISSHRYFECLAHIFSFVRTALDLNSRYSDPKLSGRLEIFYLSQQKSFGTVKARIFVFFQKKKKSKFQEF
jgi:hypothetical protein